MKTIGLYLSITMVLGLLSFGGYVGWTEIASIQETNLSLHTTLSETEQALGESRAKNQEYEGIMNYSGTLYYVGVGSNTGSEAREIIADSYDMIRFHNVSSTLVMLRLYDSRDFSWVALRTLEIASGWVSPLYLKQSGISYFTAGSMSGTIIIGKAAREKYHADSLLENEIFPMLKKDDPSSIRKAILSFKEIINTDPVISKQCHNLGHRIGHEAFEMFGFSQAISESADDICAGGYTHGILESYFLSFPELSNHPESACSGMIESKKWSCFHGVWHGLMFVYKNDVAKALTGCRTLSDAVWKNRCSEGVFMELYSGDPQHAGGNIGYETGALFAPCNQYATGSESYVCGFYAGLGYLRYADSDYIGALDICRQWWSYSKMCTAWIGREIAKRHIGDALKLEHLCGHLTQKEEYESCIQGGINYTKLQFENEPSVIDKYCRGFQNSGASCQKKGTLDE